MKGGLQFHTLVALLALGLVTQACGATQETESSQAVPDCAQEWIKERERVVGLGLPDGEARRRADLLRAKCEGIPLAEYPQGARSRKVAKAAQAEDSACASEQERKNAPPPSERDKVAIYFSCIATIGTQNQPLYMFERSVPADQQTEEGRIFTAVSEYLEGPDEQEASEGYLTAIAARVENVLNSVVIEGDHVTLDFSSGIEPHIPGASTGGQVLVREVKALASQFPQFNSVDLVIEGDCDRFWRLMEKSCQTITR